MEHVDPSSSGNVNWSRSLEFGCIVRVQPGWEFVIELCFESVICTFEWHVVFVHSDVYINK